MGHSAQFRRLLGPLVRENVLLTKQADSDLGLVRADVTQVQQVLMNLYVNAVDAMPDGGRLTIEARNFALEVGRDGASRWRSIRVPTSRW